MDVKGSVSVKTDLNSKFCYQILNYTIRRYKKKMLPISCCVHVKLFKKGSTCWCKSLAVVTVSMLEKKGIVLRNLPGLHARLVWTLF